MNAYEKRDIWLLWQLGKDGRAYLLAVDETEALVVRHQSMVRGQYVGDFAVYDGPPPHMYTEHRVTNHCYGVQGL